MSYSFHFRARTIAAALAIAASEMDKVVESQPVHAHDRDVALAAIKAQAELVAPQADDTQHVNVSVSGSLGWSGSYPDAYKLTAGNTSVNVYLMPADAKGDYLPALREV
jgi:hypothetical protein